MRVSVAIPHPEVPIESEAARSPAAAGEAVATALTQDALNHKAFDVAILDMRNLVDYTDLFVLCSARNRRHVAAIAESLRQHAKKHLAIACHGIEGLPSARWVLLDFGTVIVHVFDEPMRGFYNLDGLWSDAPRLHVPESAPSFAAAGLADEGEVDPLDDADEFDSPTGEIELSG